MFTITLLVKNMKNLPAVNKAAGKSSPPHPSRVIKWIKIPSVGLQDHFLMMQHLDDVIHHLMDGKANQEVWALQPEWHYRGGDM